MGKALVMPTNDWKILMPNTAASLQRAFKKPNAVVLKKRGTSTILVGCYNTVQQQKHFFLLIIINKYLTIHQELQEKHKISAH